MGLYIKASIESVKSVITIYIYLYSNICIYYYVCMLIYINIFYKGDKDIYAAYIS